MRVSNLFIRLACAASVALAAACANDTLRAQTPTTTTGPYNTGTTATPGLSAGHASRATGETEVHAAGDVSVPTSSAPEVPWENPSVGVVETTGAFVDRQPPPAPPPPTTR
jgi:hypothetical protein